MLNLLYYIELTWLLVDSVSGFFLNNNVSILGGQSLGAVFRIIVTAVLVAVVCKYYQPSRNLPLVLLLFMICAIFYHSLVAGPENTVKDYQFHLKLLLPILFYYVIRIQFREGALDATRLRNIVLANSVVLLGNLFLVLFGVGFSNYGVTDSGQMVGGKGFFYAGNEVNVTLAVVYALYLIVMKSRLRSSYFLLVTSLAFFFLGSILLLSKTAMLSYLFVTLIFLFLYLPLLSKIKIAVLMATLLAVTSVYWLQFVYSAIDRWTYFYSHTSTLMSFLTSMRSDRIDSFVHLYRSVFSPVDIVMGRGWMGIPGIGSFEMDVFDLLVSSGVVGLLVYVVWLQWLGGMIRAYFKHTSKEVLFGISVTSLVVGISFLAGHVMYSAMLSPFLPLFIIFCRNHKFVTTS